MSYAKKKKSEHKFMYRIGIVATIFAGVLAVFSHVAITRGLLPDYMWMTLVPTASIFCVINGIGAVGHKMYLELIPESDGD